MMKRFTKSFAVTIAIALLTSLSIPVLADDPPKDEPERKVIQNGGQTYDYNYYRKMIYGFTVSE